MRSRRGIELSANFLVMAILGIAMLGLGISFVVKATSSASNFKDNIDQQTQAQIESMLADGNKLVVIPDNTKQVKAGDSVAFGVGIRNKMSTLHGATNPDHTFKLWVRMKNPIGDGATKDEWIALDSLLGTGSVSDGTGDLVQFVQEVNIPNNEFLAKKILVTVPKKATPGQYVFDLRVCASQTIDPGTLVCDQEDLDGAAGLEEGNYGSLAKFYVSVV